MSEVWQLVIYALVYLAGVFFGAAVMGAGALKLLREQQTEAERMQRELRILKLEISRHE